LRCEPRELTRITARIPENYRELARTERVSRAAGNLEGLPEERLGWPRHGRQPGPRRTRLLRQVPEVQETSYSDLPWRRLVRWRICPLPSHICIPSGTKTWDLLTIPDTCQSLPRSPSVANNMECSCVSSLIEMFIKEKRSPVMWLGHRSIVVLSRRRHETRSCGS
jgi:hypothetical protein